MSTVSTSTSNPVESCLNILKRTAIKDSEKTFNDLDTLLASDHKTWKELKTENPNVILNHKVDPSDSFKRSYIQSEYNRIGDSFRSPWSNTFDPPLVSSDEDLDGIYRPSQRLRLLEIQYNDAFAAYCEAYYGKEAVSSVYLHDTVTNESGTSSATVQGFSACFAIKKTLESKEDNDPCMTGFWNSVHIVTVGECTGGCTTYNVKSNTCLSLENPVMMAKSDSNSQVQQSVSKSSIDAVLSRNVERSCKVHDGASSHLANIGKMIEEVENDIRSSMESIYIPKTREISESLHATTHEVTHHKATHRERKQQVSMELNEEMLARILKKTVTSPL